MEGDQNVPNMADLWNRFFANVMKQGFSITLLVIYVALSQYQNNLLQKDIKDCQNSQVEYFKQDRLEFIQIMANVEAALRDNTKVMRKITNDEE